MCAQGGEGRGGAGGEGRPLPRHWNSRQPPATFTCPACGNSAPPLPVSFPFPRRGLPFVTCLPWAVFTPPTPGGGGEFTLGRKVVCSADGRCHHSPLALVHSAILLVPVRKLRLRAGP